MKVLKCSPQQRTIQITEIQTCNYMRSSEYADNFCVLETVSVSLAG